MTDFRIGTVLKDAMAHRLEIEVSSSKVKRVYKGETMAGLITINFDIEVNDSERMTEMDRFEIKADIEDLLNEIFYRQVKACYVDEKDIFRATVIYGVMEKDGKI